MFCYVFLLKNAYMHENVCFTHRRCYTYIETFKRFNGSIRDFDIASLTVVSEYFICVRMPQPVTLFKKRLWHRCFPVNFAKFLKAPFFTEHLRMSASDGC